MGAALAIRAQRGGHTWAILQYLLGLQRLGHDVLLIDRIGPESCTNWRHERCPFRESQQLAYLDRTLREFGLGENYALILGRGEDVAGMPLNQVTQRTRDADLFLNVMGFIELSDDRSDSRLDVFVDIDPGYPQLWRELGLVDVLSGHDAYVTIGLNVGEESCAIPVAGVEWITTSQPVVLALWPDTRPLRSSDFTSIASWRGGYGPLNYAGKTYGPRVREFRKFIELPTRCRERFELAIDIHPSEKADIELLAANDWHLVDPTSVAGDPPSYQAYIQNSKAEFMVAQNIYVQTGSGWFSDRSICYLASGKPVLAQDTGLASHYPVGEGLLTFATLDDAIAGVEAISHGYDRQCRAARAIAEEYFDSDKVLSRLLEKLGVH